MISSTAARRYAKGLLQLAIEKGTLEQIMADMQQINADFKGTPALQKAMISPVIRDDKKLQIIQEIFKGKLSETSQRLVEVLASKSRLGLLFAVAVRFEQLYNQHKGILEITITSAYELDKTLLNDVVARFSENLGLTIKPDVQVNKSLLGGITVKYHDTVVDGSVRNKIEQLTRTLQTSAA